MTKDQLYQELNYVNHSRDKRLYYANMVIANPSLVKPLLDILFTVDDKVSCRAAWVFEFTCGENLSVIIPHLDIFTQNISKVHLDSAVRPIAKVCEYIAKAYYGKTNLPIRNKLTHLHKEKIVEACFDWMITEEKVAPKAYGMNALYLFGKDFDWIHPELAMILQNDFAKQSAAYKARAKRILKKIQ